MGCPLSGRAPVDHFSLKLDWLSETEGAVRAEADGATTTAEPAAITNAATAPAHARTGRREGEESMLE